MLKKLKRLMDWTPQPVKKEDTSIISDEVLTALKPTRAPELQNFMDGFDMIKHSSVDKKIANPPIIPYSKNVWVGESVDKKPAKVAPYKSVLSDAEKRALLASSIIIMMKSPVSSSDLEYIGKSRINGRPIYRYTGDDFASLYSYYSDMEIEEVVYNPGFGI